MTWKVGLALLGATAGVHGADHLDEIAVLPGFGSPPSKQWSGFLSADSVEEGTSLHYWYAEAEAPADPETAPVVLWLNGGPGSSSILGMLQENGPLLINATGGLMRNPFAWTKQANLLVLESPAGVGFSYCAAMKKGGNCANTDISTAKAARAALQHFFNAKFPELKKHDFFITGESYAGVYIPTLSQEVLDNAPEIPLRGIAVGDPCTDNKAQNTSMDMLWYAHKNGLVPDDDFDLLWNTCRSRQPSFLGQGAWQRVAGNRWQSALRSKASDLSPSDDAKCKLAYRKFLATTSKAISQDWQKAYINNLDLFADAAPLDWTIEGSLDYYQAKWLNSPEVKKALHVESSPSKAWPGPAEGWSYTSSYSACNPAAAEGTDSMVNFYRRIAPRLRTTIVFNGDVDPCVSYEGTRNAIQSVGFAVKPGMSYRPWFFNKAAVDLATFQEKPGLFGPDLELRDAGAQFGGQVVNYEHNLTFATVHGSGHMVPQFRPQAAVRLLSRLLSGEDFAPALPLDDEIANMTEDQFNKAVDAWTDKAKAFVSVTPASTEAMVVV